MAMNFWGKLGISVPVIGLYSILVTELSRHQGYHPCQKRSNSQWHGLPSQPQLYHLEDDPEELLDLAAAEPERVRSMERLIRPWIELGRVKARTSAHLDDAAREQLEALGYLGD